MGAEHSNHPAEEEAHPSPWNQVPASGHVRQTPSPSFRHPCNSDWATERKLFFFHDRKPTDHLKMDWRRFYADNTLCFFCRSTSCWAELYSFLLDVDFLPACERQNDFSWAMKTRCLPQCEVWSIVDHSYLPKRTAFLFLDFAAPFYVTVLVKRGNLCISGELSFSNKGSRRSPTTWVMVTNGLSTDAIRNPGAQSTWSSLGVALSCALIGNRSPSLECLEDPPRWNGCLPPR